MAVLKCKMCGGELNIEEGSTVCECEYCGSKQTVPTADNEKKMTLFQRANRLRFNNEFDKAAGIYENIITDFPEEAEAYWGLVLCKYGIEYVDDPGTAKKVPTCHRSSFDSVFEDNNFDMVMEYADPISKRVYREEAKQIEELRKGIIEVSSKEDPYDIFICYKETDEDGNRTLDSVIAQDIYTALTDKGYKVFFSRITLEDKLGQEYEPYIFAALHSAKVMLAVGTQYEYYDAVWVKNEWSRYLQLISSGEKKVLIPCFKDLDAYDMPKEFARLQAQDMGKIGAMQDLLRGIEKIIGSKTEKEEVRFDDSGISVLNAQTESLLKRGNMALVDGDFTKANEFYERVLDNDAENARAYWGKTLCAYQVKDAKNLAGKLFKDIVYNKKRSVVDFPAALAIEIVREMDTSGLLKELNDEELEDVLRKSHLMPKDDEFLSIKPYYQDSANRYSLENNVIDLINNNDCRAAYRYRDGYVEEQIDIIKNYLQKSIVSAIQESEKYDFISNFRDNIDEALSLLSEKITEQKTKLENESGIAEEQYGKTDNERAELESKIKQLENEKEKLKGLFASKKRQELNKNIQLLKQKIDRIKLGKASESKPIKESNQEASLMKSTAKLFYTVARKAPTIDEIKKGFGTYPYGKDGDKKPIQWRILEQKGDRVLLITEVGIDGKSFNEIREDVTWGTSGIRHWLNTTFLTNAFTDEEQSCILTTTVSIDMNPRYNRNSGNDTEDKIFLLSIQDAERYYSSKSERVVKATPYAIMNGIKQTDQMYDAGNKWWLRSLGDYRSGTFAYVDEFGSIAYRGDFADSSIYAVRPALWLEIKE